jgi:hypothetical protein
MSEQPWDRLPNETNRWYQRFSAFRLAGPTRSINGLYNQERVAKGLERAQSASGKWREMASSNRWVERAEAWDTYLSERAEAEYEARWQKEIMGRTEILGRLSRMGRAKPHDFFTWDKHGGITGFNMRMLNDHGDLVKKLGTKTTLYGTEYIIELYDGQAATVKMGQHEKLFIDVQEHQGQVTSVEMTMAEWQEMQSKNRQKAVETLAAFEDEVESE